MLAKLAGAALYAGAAAGATYGVLALEGPVDFTQLRESVPLAAVIGAVLGFGVNPRWPTRADSAVATGLLPALAGDVIFSGLYLVASAFIEAYLGRNAAEAVSGASSRLGRYLPVGGPLTIGAFMGAALLMWAMGAVGRALFGRRAAAEKEGGAGSEPDDKGDPGAAQAS